MKKHFILEVPAGTVVEIREYDNCNTITMYEKPEPILVHDLIFPDKEIETDADLVPNEVVMEDTVND